MESKGSLKDTNVSGSTLRMAFKETLGLYFHFSQKETLSLYVDLGGLCPPFPSSCISASLFFSFSHLSLSFRQHLAKFREQEGKVD